MRDEYDFSGGERGKHFREYPAQSDRRNRGETRVPVTLEEVRKIVTPLCREFDVRRLDAFGSVARGEAGRSSDVDLLVEFRDPDRSPAKRFFGLLHRLEDDLGSDVDLLTVNGLRNPYFRRRVMQERVPIYEG